MVSSLVSMVIVFLQTFYTCNHFLASYFIENKNSYLIFITFYLNLTIWFSSLKTWVDISCVGAYLFFQPQKRKINDKERSICVGHDVT